jgi:hypothetical protein
MSGTVPSPATASLQQLLRLAGPSVDVVTPVPGQRGIVVTVDGNNFASTRTDNEVAVGGAPAFVLAATATRLTVLTGPDTETGPVNAARIDPAPRRAGPT